ncbi:hypothetical protein [Labilithrix luteola]|nr:hypothetical protein [Labilithrix luteola]
MARAFLLVFLAVASVGCGKHEPTTPGDAGAGNPCNGRVQTGAPCTKEGAMCRFTGPMSEIAPIATPGEPPDCYCTNKTWSCPSVASPLPPPR